MTDSTFLDRPSVHRTLVAAALIAFAVLACASVRSKSVTTDEYVHIAAGYWYWKRGDFRLNPEHPPLAKLLGAVPLVVQGFTFDPSAAEWQAARDDPGRQFAIAARFLQRPENLRRHRELLFAARAAMTLAGLILCVYVYRLGRELFGPRAGLLALMVTALSPTVLAHARLVTTDVMVTAMWTAALYHMLRRTRGGGGGHLAACGLAAGCAMASKFSGVLVVPLLAAAGAVSLVARDGVWKPGRFMKDHALVGGIAVFVVAATYFFHAFPDYLRGFSEVWANHDPRREMYLLGRYSRDGFLGYFLVAMLVKMPIGTLLLAALGAFGRRREPPSATTWSERCLIGLPAVVVFVLVTAAGRDLGIRYVLPVLPAVFLLAGRAAVVRHVAGRTPGTVAACALAAWVAVAAVAAFPDYIPYFNEAAGGSRGGAAILDDSNIDWGQERVSLADYQRRHGIGEVRLWSRNMLDPTRLYGIRGRIIGPAELLAPRPGWYALGAHVLTRSFPLNPGRVARFDWLERYEPVAVLGGSLYLFRFHLLRPGESAPPDAVGTVLTVEVARRHARERGERWVRDYPDHSSAYVALGSALLAEGRPEPALEALRRGASIALARLDRATTMRRRIDLLSAVDRFDALAALKEEAEQLVTVGRIAANAPDRVLTEQCVRALRGALSAHVGLPEPERRLVPWALRDHVALTMLELRAMAAAMRFVTSGAPRDEARVRRCAARWNRRARELRGRQALSAERIIAYVRDRMTRLR